MPERRWLLRVGDVLVIALCILGSLWVWSIMSSRELNTDLLEDQVVWIALMSGGWLVWLWANGLYELRQALLLRRTLVIILIGASLIAFAYLLVFFLSFSRPGTIPIDSMLGEQPTLRIAPLLSIISTTAALIGFRSAYTLVWRGARTRRRVLVLGAGSAGKAVARELRSAHGASYELVGFIDDDPAKLGKSFDGTPVLGGHDRMVEFVRRHDIDEIVVAISAGVQGSVFQEMMDCHERGVGITPMPIMYEQLTGRIAVEHIGSQWYVALPLGQSGFGAINQLAKRALDLVAGLFILAVFFALTPFIALAIRLDSRGNTFYRQERMGKHGRVFHVYKFRTMVQNAEPHGKAIWASENDPRVTRVGKFLRKSRLDELPQIINVLSGEMSIVGPRPERPQLVAELQRQIPFYRTRLATKPGLTGWAQINHGYVGTVEDTAVKLQYDLYYIKHASPLFDLRIMAKTIGVMLRMEGR